MRAGYKSPATGVGVDNVSCVAVWHRRFSVGLSGKSAKISS